MSLTEPFNKERNYTNGNLVHVEVSPFTEDDVFFSEIGKGCELYHPYVECSRCEHSSKQRNFRKLGLITIVIIDWLVREKRKNNYPKPRCDYLWFVDGSLRSVTSKVQNKSQFVLRSMNLTIF